MGPKTIHGMSVKGHCSILLGQQSNGANKVDVDRVVDQSTYMCRKERILNVIWNSSRMSVEKCDKLWSLIECALQLKKNLAAVLISNTAFDAVRSLPPLQTQPWRSIAEGTLLPPRTWTHLAMHPRRATRLEGLP